MRLASDILRDAAQTFDERNAVYGNNYLRVGLIMAAHFPDGLTVKTPDDWNRLHLFILGVVKDTRYANNWKDGHQDSVRDATVYRSMLEMVDEEIDNRPQAGDGKQTTTPNRPAPRIAPSTPQRPAGMANGGDRGERQAVAHAPKPFGSGPAPVVEAARRVDEMPTWPPEGTKNGQG